MFPEGTDVKVKRDGAILRAPGIGDDGRPAGQTPASSPIVQASVSVTRALGFR